jgi:hypothetical protein
MGGWVALGTSIISLGVIFTKINNNIKDGGARLSNAMYGSSESLNKMAEAFGRMTPNQQAIQRQADLAAGQATSEEAKQQSSKFMESGSGQQLLKDLSLVKKMGEDQVSALKNQLASAVITGVITSEEARQIATDVGIALKDKNLAVNVAGQLSTLLGPNGEKIDNNRMEILASISPTVDTTKIKQETQKQMEVIRNAKLNPFDVGYDFGMALERANIAVSKLFGENVENARALNTLQENILENAKKEAEVRALINSEYQSGKITFSEREKQLSNNRGASGEVDKIFKDAGVSGLKTNVSGGTEYKSLLNIPTSLRGVGGLLTNNTKNAEMTTGATGSKESINAAVDFVNKTHKEFSTALSSSGIDENRQEIIKDYIDRSLKGNAELIAKYELDILSGNKSLAAVDMAAGLETSDPALAQSIMMEGKYGAGDSRNLLAATESASKFADPGVQDKVLQMASKGQNAEIDALVTNYEKVQALNPEIAKSIKVDLETNIGDINKIGPITEELNANFKLLDQLPVGIDKESFFKFNAVDANGKAIPLNDLAEKIKDFNAAYNNLDSGDKKLRKEAEIAIYKTVNDDPKAAEDALAEAKKDIKDFEKLPGSIRAEVMVAYAATGLAEKALNLYMDQGGKIDSPKYTELNNAYLTEEKKRVTTVATAIAGGPAPGDPGAKSALQSSRDAARQTKEVIAGQAKLLAAGISLEALEGLSPEAIIELSKKSGKALRDNIKLFNEQAESIKINKLVLEQLALEENPVKKALEDSKKAVEGYDDQIKELNKTIEKSNRADELDRRRIEDRNKALDNLSKKEKNVNDQYDERIKALDKVANANDRVAERQRQQIDLASALTSGDIAGAAQAAAAMTQTGAQNQIEDTKTALEAQRQAELDGLTESVNGRLMTRKDIQAEIDAIEETIYQRNINLRVTNDAIYTVQTSINAEKSKQDSLNKILEEQEKVQVDLAKKKMDHSKETTKQSKEQLNNAIKQAYVQAGGFKKTRMTLSEYQKDLGLAFGGMVKKYAFGGNVGYKGSREAPPRLKMARGSIVPGLGNTDRVPALLTPGEFVVRKSVAQANMPLLKALNSDVFPTMSLNTPDVAPTVTSSTSTILNNTPVYNYSISVNVPNTTASPDEIANVVVSRIKRSMDTNIRSNRY